MAELEHEPAFQTLIDQLGDELADMIIVLNLHSTYRKKIAIFKLILKVVKKIRLIVEDYYSNT